MAHRGKVYVIDDDEAMRDSLDFLLGSADFHVTLFESAPRLGGKVRSQASDGYLVEWAANGWIASRGTLDLARSLGVSEAVRPAARQRQLRRSSQKNCRQRDDHGDLDEAVIQHGLPPPGMGDRALEARSRSRPHPFAETGGARQRSARHRRRRRCTRRRPSAHRDRVDPRPDRGAAVSSRSRSHSEATSTSRVSCAASSTRTRVACSRPSPASCRVRTSRW